MKSINSRYVLVEKLPKEEKEGFQTVEVQDEFLYRGRVKRLPAQPQYVDSYALQIGDIVIWAKYSPDTMEFEKDKFVATNDILAVL